jgi:aspartyl-tRNA(Asn)/glutamyl-tRNA(Gln) amidotransferase subunit C
MSTISTDDVRHVARLARIRMNDEQIATMAGELDTILESIGKISELDLADVEPTTHALEVVNVIAPDVPHQSLTNEQALQNAPDAVDGTFRVPQMKS